jgi:hypothetical protein
VNRLAAATTNPLNDFSTSMGWRCRPPRNFPWIELTKHVWFEVVYCHIAATDNILFALNDSNNANPILAA